MSDKTNNINISGGTIGGLQVGDGNNQTITQNFGEQEATVDALFAAIREGLRQLPEVDRQTYMANVIEPLEEMAKLPEEEQKSPTVMERVKEACGRLAPFAPTLNKALLAFGKASLEALATRNPVVAGVRAAIESVST